MVKLLTEALRRTCHGNRRTVSTLEEIEKQLLGASQLDDLPALKSKLEFCLASVRTEVARQVADDRATCATLKTVTALRNSEPAPGGSGSAPPAYLPGRQEIRAYLDRARALDATYYAVVLSLDRMTAVENRFGSEAGEAYLLMASQSIAQRLGARDGLFEWSRQALLAIVESTGSGNSESEVANLSGAHRPCTMELGKRTVLIPISISSQCLRVSEAPDTDTLMEMIDSFVSKAAA